MLATGSFDATAAIWVGNSTHNGEDGERREREQNTNGEAEEEDEDEDDYHFAVVLEGHDSEIKSLAWSSSGTYLATCSRDKSVWIWESLSSSSNNGTFGYAGPADDDEDNYETVAVLQEHDGDVKCVAWHPEEETCLVSASYDEGVRVWREDEADGEWGCVAVLEGHGGTVWCVDWEGSAHDDQHNAAGGRDRVDPAAAGVENNENGEDGPQAISGPRIVTCSDDKTIRIWRRKPKTPKPAPSAGPRIPSIIRSAGQEEEWYEETRLPQRHERAIYSVAWSKKTGRIVSAGSDGMIVVYEEEKSPAGADVTMQDSGDKEEQESSETKEWKVVFEVQAAHGVFEINHICWSKRWDREKSNKDEEVIVSTGDDGEVKVWIVDSA